MKTNRVALAIAFTTLLVLVSTGCHTVNPAIVRDASKFSGKKNLYVVSSTNKDRGFRKEIERNLTARGFIVSSGTLDGMGPEQELYVTYDDRWSWDMVMYPRLVKISIYDAKTRELLGSCDFKNRAFHTFPDPPEITDELIGRIFGEPEGSYMK